MKMDLFVYYTQKKIKNNEFNRWILNTIFPTIKM